MRPAHPSSKAKAWQQMQHRQIPSQTQAQESCKNTSWSNTAAHEEDTEHAQRNVSRGTTYHTGNWKHPQKKLFPSLTCADISGPRPSGTWGMRKAPAALGGELFMVHSAGRLFHPEPTYLRKDRIHGVHLPTSEDLNLLHCPLRISKPCKTKLLSIR